MIAKPETKMTPDTAKRLLDEYGRGEPWTEHCRAVADVALRLGRELRRVRPLDLDLLWSTALLHDVGRHSTHDPILHGVAGFDLLTALGHDEAAFVCASHVLFGLAAEDALAFGLPARDFMPLTLEQRLVPLADFLVEGTRTTTLEARFASLRRRNAGDDVFMARLECAQQRATAFMRELERELEAPVELLAAPDETGD